MNKTGGRRKNVHKQGKCGKLIEQLLSHFFVVKFLSGCVFCPRSYFVGDCSQKGKMCTVDIEKYRVPSSSCLFLGEDAGGG
jgi:hypothetical protein